MRLMHEFQKVKRLTPVPGEDRRENDAEHSYFLALLAWYIVDDKKLDMDASLVIRYAFIHDLVEVYAGDTVAYGLTKRDLQTKHQRERDAQERLAKEFPDFPDLHRLIAVYEEQKDKESRFVRGLDKIIAPLTVYLDKSSLWKENGITLEEGFGYKWEVVKDHPETEKLCRELFEAYKKEEETFFVVP